MTERQAAERRGRVEELLLPDGHALMLRKSVLIEVGQAYWVDGQSLVVEDVDERQLRFDRDEETRCYRG